MTQPRDSRRRSRAARAQSFTSDSSFAPNNGTPHPPPRQQATRGVRAATVESEGPTAQPGSEPKAAKIPAHYVLPPTVPNPFTGSLDTSLDAILTWGQRYAGVENGAGVQNVVDTLLRPVSSATNWPVLLRAMSASIADSARARKVSESLLFLVTRTLLPEQITENRGFMARLYERRKHFAIRLILRYDMVREWKMDQTGHPRAVASLPPGLTVQGSPPNQSSKNELGDVRRPFMPNVWSTLIAAPHGGFATHGVRERMKHHITDLDRYLLLKDEDVASWGAEALIIMTSQAVLHWQWLRQNNDTLEGMEAKGWDELEGKADECNWVADDFKKPGFGKRDLKAKAMSLEDDEI